MHRSPQRAAVDLDLTELRQDDYRTWPEEHDDAPERQAITTHLGPRAAAVTEAGLTPARVTSELEGQLTLRQSDAVPRGGTLFVKTPDSVQGHGQHF